MICLYMIAKHPTYLPYSHSVLRSGTIVNYDTLGPRLFPDMEAPPPQILALPDLLFTGLHWLLYLYSYTYSLIEQLLILTIPNLQKRK